MSAVTETPKKNFYVHVGAPAPILVRVRAGGTGGTLTAFDSTLKFQYSIPSGAVVLGVGSGITLSTDETIANALATIQLTVGQSRALPSNALIPYELQRITSGREEVVIMGKLIPEGGVNPDA